MYISDDSQLSNIVNIHPRVSSDHVTDCAGKRLIEFCISTSMVIGNGRLHNDSNIGDFTFHSSRGSSVVDYILLSKSDLNHISDFKVLSPNEYSDHSGLEITFKSRQHISSSENYTDTNTTNNHIKWDSSKASDFRTLISNKRNDFEMLQNMIQLNENIDIISQSFTDILYNCTEAVFGKQKKHKTHTHNTRFAKQPWFNNSCYEARANFKRKRNLFLRHKTDRLLREQYTEAKSHYNKTKRKEKAKYSKQEKSNLAYLSKSQPRTFWKKVKKQYTKQQTSSDNLNINDLHDHFKQLYTENKLNEQNYNDNNNNNNNSNNNNDNDNNNTNDNDNDIDNDNDNNNNNNNNNNDNDNDNNNTNDNDNDIDNDNDNIFNLQGQQQDENLHILDSDISINELKEAVFSQKNNKSSGSDCIIAEVFKYAFDDISSFLVSLFNRVFSNNEYPTQWGSGIIVPIFKGGDADEAKNYRGITLINIISKIYSQILLNRLTKWTQLHDKIIDNQFGFQKGKSTVDCIFLLHSIIHKTLNSRKRLYCAFIDFEKCFDKLNRTFIFQKLIQENVSPKFVNAIKNMYTTVKAAVRLHSELSPFFSSDIGAKQGDPSSSLLFLYFVNDILENINDNVDNLFTLNEQKIYMFLFADDAILFGHTPQALQHLLDNLNQYCNTWGLKINTAKTKIMIFENGRHTTHNFFLNEELLEIVKNMKYLGIHIFKNGHIHRTQQKVAQHAAYPLHNLFIVFNQLKMNINEKIKLFDSLISPILNYGAEIIGDYEGKDIERIHCKFLRKILCVKKVQI